MSTHLPLQTNFQNGLLWVHWRLQPTVTGGRPGSTPLQAHTWPGPFLLLASHWPEFGARPAPGAAAKVAFLPGNALSDLNTLYSVATVSSEEKGAEIPATSDRRLEPRRHCRWSTRLRRMKAKTLNRHDESSEDPTALCFQREGHHRREKAQGEVGQAGVHHGRAAHQQGCHTWTQHRGVHQPPGEQGPASPTRPGPNSSARSVKAISEPPSK